MSTQNGGEDDRSKQRKIYDICHSIADHTATFGSTYLIALSKSFKDNRHTAASKTLADHLGRSAKLLPDAGRQFLAQHAPHPDSLAKLSRHLHHAGLVLGVAEIGRAAVAGEWNAALSGVVNLGVGYYVGGLVAAGLTAVGAPAVVTAVGVVAAAYFATDFVSTKFEEWDVAGKISATCSKVSNFVRGLFASEPLAELQTMAQQQNASPEIVAAAHVHEEMRSMLCSLPAEQLNLENRRMAMIEARLGLMTPQQLDAFFAQAGKLNDAQHALETLMDRRRQREDVNQKSSSVEQQQQQQYSGFTTKEQEQVRELQAVIESGSKLMEFMMSAAPHNEAERVALEQREQKRREDQQRLCSMLEKNKSEQQENQAQKQQQQVEREQLEKQAAAQQKALQEQQLQKGQQQNFIFNFAKK